jgi:hypothetical protein
MGIADQTMFNYFLYDRKPLPYNQLPYGNCSERTIEIPLALRFLLDSSAGQNEPYLEIGNVLSYYQALLDPHPSLANRLVLDKFEEARGVLNVDLMEYEKKHRLILCLSTVEHIGQHAYGENKSGNREMPLSAIRRIYNLLEPDGSAFITVPYGKLMDVGWLIQFSAEYIELLFDSYGLPRQAATFSYFRKLDMDMHLNTPRQCWVQCNKEELAGSMFDSPFMFANGIALIHLRKVGKDVTASPVPARGNSLSYSPAPIIPNLYFTPFIRPAGFDKDGRLPAIRPGYVFYGPHITLEPRTYFIQAFVEIIGQGQFTIELTSNSGERLLWSHTLTHSANLKSSVNVVQEEKAVELRMYKHNQSECYVRVPSLLLETK